MAFMAAPSGGGDFNTYIKYNAKAGRWYTKPSDSDAPEYEIKNMQAVVDLPRLQTGWFLFASGAAPHRVIDAVVGAPGAQPSPSHKRGFQVLMFSPTNIGGVREFSTTAGTVIDAFNALHDAYLAAPESKQGKLPVFACTDVVPVTVKNGTNYTPVLQIVGWTDPPAELANVQMEGSSASAAGAAAPVSAPAAAPVSAPVARQPAQHVAPPGAAPAANTPSSPAPAAAAGGNLF
jgi:hypothetical protein